jgi:hypothetical protein
MPERGVRPWVEPAARMEADQVRPVFSEETRILGRLRYRDGRESWEPRIMRPAVAQAVEDED